MTAFEAMGIAASRPDYDRADHWLDRAECGTADPRLFTDDNLSEKAVSLALTYCQRCPVIKECEERLDKTAHPTGVWAGRLVKFGKSHKEGGSLAC